ncbi:hypothetical protein FM106_05355 [Brachybacterium faecium]|nr:hypothetical protein FM106_05355 [Brachybacterium faecium]
MPCPARLVHLVPHMLRRRSCPSCGGRWGARAERGPDHRRRTSVA